MRRIWIVWTVAALAATRCDGRRAAPDAPDDVAYEDALSDSTRHPFGRRPRYEDYPVRERFRGQPADADLSSHADALRFGEALRLGARRGPDFAGHYTIVSRSCGRLCREFVIVDAKTGRVFPGLIDTPPFEYRLNSRLIAFEAPAPLSGSRATCGGCSATYYVWEYGRLEVIPPELWIGAAPPPAAARSRLDSLRAEERSQLERAAPAVVRPTWDRLVIAARDGSRRVFSDQLIGDTIVALHIFLGAIDPGGQYLVRELRSEGDRYHLVDPARGDVGEVDTRRILPRDRDSLSPAPYSP